ncbi:hypothetical protein HDU96_002300 [Phlyctochytrium bullatum]|nr:hypothetical protein HDU96_002300 [Phlyctochytrium bullatum]
MASQGIALVLGVGPGTGAAISRAFARKGLTVAMLARNQAKLDTLAEQISKEGGKARGFSCDVSSSSSIVKAVQAISDEFPEQQVRVGVFNAGGFAIKPFLDVTAEDIARNQSFVTGAFVFAQEVIRLIQKHGEGGTLIFTGATAGLRAGARFSTFATEKFAIRALSQSLAREFNPQGIHVAHAIIDGLIDTDAVASQVGAAAPDTRLSPDAIAEAYVYLHEQKRSVWTHELDMRPFVEKF